MPTLVLPPRATPDSEVIGGAARRAGWEVERLTTWRPPAWLAGRWVVLYGEPLFADIVAEPLGLALLEPSLDWVATLPPAYRGRQIRFTTLGEARTYQERAFVKPAADKCFRAGVYASGASLPASAAGLPDSTPVLQAEPVQWDVEFRCFVLDRTVVTMSPYLRYGELAQAEDGTWLAAPDEAEAAHRFGMRVVGDPLVRLPPAVVVDIGIIAGRGWAVVEANAAWGSGIYGCQSDRILPVLARASVPADAITDDDRPWLRERAEVTR